MNSIPKKFLFLAAMLNMAVLAVAADNENVFEIFGRSIDHAMNKYFTAQVIFSLIGITMLLVIVAVLNESRRSNKIKREMLALAMAKYDLQAEKLNLRLGSATILKQIAQKTGLQDPSSLLTFSHVFEDALEKYYESEKIDTISNEILVQISASRKLLGFSPLPTGIAITSTRQFCASDEFLIQIPETDPPTHKGTCQLLDSDERRWVVTHPAEWPPLQMGTWVRMNLTKQGDAEYDFKTHVLRDSGEELVLGHTNKLNRTQQRNWLRVNADIPVKATIIEESHMGGILSGKIVDISGGGLGMALPSKLSKNTMLLLNFELPGRGKIIDLYVKVVRIGGIFEGDPSKIVHSVAFAGEIDLAHEKIVQYVFEKQREGLQVKRPMVKTE